MGQKLPVVVFGGSGFVGRTLVRRLKSSGQHDVRSYSVIDCNLLSKEAARSCLQSLTPDASIVMCASIPRAVEATWRSFESNLAMVRNLLDALPEKGIRSLIYLSSVDVYGMPPSEKPLRETSPCVPSDFHGLAKLACELALRIDFRLLAPTTILRLPSLYGPGDGFLSVVGRFLVSRLRNEAVPLHGNGQNRRDLVYVDDVCGVIEHFLNEPEDILLNVATGTSASVMEMLQLVADTLQVGANFEVREADPRRRGDLAFDISALRAACPDFRPTSLADGIRRYISALS